MSASILKNEDAAGEADCADAAVAAAEDPPAEFDDALLLAIPPKREGFIRSKSVPS